MIVTRLENVSDEVQAGYMIFTGGIKLTLTNGAELRVIELTNGVVEVSTGRARHLLISPVLHNILNLSTSLPGGSEKVDQDYRNEGDHANG